MARHEVGQSNSRARRIERRQMRWLNGHNERMQRDVRPALPISADIVVLERKKLTPLQRRVKGFLTAAYQRGLGERQQRVEDQRVKDAYEAGNRKLLNAYRKSDDFASFYEKTQAEIKKGKSGKPSDKEFRGGLFSSIAFAWLREGQDHPGQVILGQQDAFRFAQMVNPDAAPVLNQYNGDGLDGRYVPDFLVLGIRDGQVEIEKFGEISLASNPDKYDGQIKGFRIMKGKLGPIAKHARFSILTHRGGDPLAIPIIPGSECVDVDPIPLNFWDFTDFATNVERKYRQSVDALTLAELRIETKVQIMAQMASMGEPAFFRSSST